MLPSVSGSIAGCRDRLQPGSDRPGRNVGGGKEDGELSSGEDWDQFLKRIATRRRRILFTPCWGSARVAPPSQKITVACRHFNATKAKRSSSPGGLWVTNPSPTADPPPTPRRCASYSPPGSWTAASGPAWWCCKRPASRTEASRAGALPEARCTGSWPAARRSSPSRSDAGRRGRKTARSSGSPDQGSGRNDRFSRGQTKTHGS